MPIIRYDSPTMEALLPSQLRHFLAQETPTSTPLAHATPTVFATIDLAPILLVFLYAAILLSYASRSFRSYRKGHKETDKLTDTSVIIVHSLSGISELAQFYFPTQHSLATVPLSAVLLCAIQSATNLILVRKLHRGNPALVRPVYQAGALFRIALMLAAYQCNSRGLYHDSVVVIHAFAYTRLICYLLTTANGFSESEVPEYDVARRGRAGSRSGITVAQTYTAAVYGAALLAMGQMERVRCAGVVFLALVGVVVRVEEWVSFCIVWRDIGLPG
ncbi:hypothetical protein Dda_6567 [Drechslerella dactyloides]|uniref:Uncharacterized protein n=1 Tax=Drechslerella dactyloides TaxID=74499 RepID=A0AAD6IU07_DREDA|nr:hypothetical protein Dda_6567 [Drechslerella dactyloides]